MTSSNRATRYAHPGAALTLASLLALALVLVSIAGCASKTDHGSPPPACVGEGCSDGIGTGGTIGGGSKDAATDGETGSADASTDGEAGADATSDAGAGG